MMKLTIILLITTFMQVSASIYAQKITLVEKNATLENVLREISEQCNYDFVFSPKMLKEANPVNVKLTNAVLAEALEKSFANQPLTYTIANNAVVVKRRTFINDVGIQENISGLIVDSEGLPLPGVSIKIRDAATATVSDNKGAYSIPVKDGDKILVFSYIGFATQEVSIEDRKVINVTLVAEASSLNEVVVVGYGTQKKVNLTGSVSTVNFDKEMDSRPITNASQALSGKVPGLWVSQTSGKPGSDGAQLRVRGWGTLNDANPMVLIDGVEGSISQVNPKDIERMTVLKDAASAAIYGSKAANGVILITTKSGRYNQKARINLSSYAGYQSLARKFDIIDNSVEYMELWNQALANKGSSPIFPESVIDDFRNNSDPYLYPNTNFFEEVYRSALISEHNLSVSGGSDNTKYFVSINGLQQNGIMKETNSTRYGLNFSIESKVKDWLNIGGRMNSMQKKSKEPYNLSRVAYVFANGAYPFTAPYNKDGTFGAVQAFNSNGEMIVGNRNPLIDVYDGLTSDEQSFTKMNAFIDIIVNDYFTLKSNFATQHRTTLIDKYNQAFTGFTSTGEEAPNLDYGAVSTLEASRDNESSLMYSWFNTLNFNKEFNEKHDVSAVAGFQIESTKAKTALARRAEPPLEGLTQVSAGTSGSVAEGNMEALRMMSYFGRANYAFSGKYLFEVNARADASSRFSQDQRWGLFPGLSVGWRMSEERFMKSQNIFSALKFRGSWGKLGNQNIAGYWPYLTTISQNFGTSYNYNGALAPGAAVTTLVDESITWETTTSMDIGVDAGFLNNNLLLEVNYFNKETDDIIVRLPIPLTLGGMGAPYENVGKMTNKGIELNINYSNPSTDRQSFSYSLGANFTYVTNEVTKFRGGDSPDQLYLIREGYSYRTLYAFDTEGIYQTDQEASEHMHANGYIPKAGDLKYKDLNGDGKLDFNDMTEIGNTIPKYNFGANLNFSYKGFDLGILMQGVAGVNVDTRSAWTQPFGVSGAVVTKRWRNAWTPENTQTDMPILKINDTWNRQNSAFWITDLSFIKVKNIQLGYTFSESFINKIGMNSLYTYINAQNVFTFVNKDYEGFDPERSTFDSGYTTYPLSRVLSFGVNVSF